MDTDVIVKLARVEAVATDVDGTLTISRSNYRIDVEALNAIQLLEDHGIKVILVSGNALPVVRGLARYLGATGPVVAENGCIIGYRNEVIKVCRRSTREVLEEILRVFGEVLEESWQNPYREYDYALRLKRNNTPEQQRKIVEVIQEYILSKGYTWVKVVPSGFAIHVKPVESDKGKGLIKALELINVDPSRVVGIGDGVNDLELLEVTGISATVSNADKPLMDKVDIVLSKPSGKGFAELVKLILKAKKLI